MYQFIVLMYHNFSDKRQNKYTLDFKTFNNQLDKLLVDGFVIEGFDGLLKRIKSGEWPERYVLITIDDGEALLRFAFVTKSKLSLFLSRSLE